MPWRSAGEGALRYPSLLEFREDKKLETVVIEKEAAVDVPNAAPTRIVKINDRERGSFLMEGSPRVSWRNNTKLSRSSFYHAA